MENSESVAGLSGPDGPLLRLVRDRRIAFLLVGGFNTAWAYVLFIGFELGLDRGYMVSLVLTHVIGTTTAFILYRKLVFRVTGHVLLDYVRFQIVYAGAFAINAVCLPLLVEVASLKPIIAQFFFVFVTTMLSWFGHQHFSFRRKDPA
ncbi:GtrA family protein [Aeromicrobium sp. Leaf350]|uniref:GtrA family protein n=1 Tax=Aeromicrobium sp. Leaf350 TaxID=2876565 RepID=UPI001E2C74E2|nr:GtrA family protein [Aeromicrobium sp. Leaf350]